MRASQELQLTFRTFADSARGSFKLNALSEGKLLAQLTVNKSTMNVQGTSVAEIVTEHASEKVQCYCFHMCVSVLIAKFVFIMKRKTKESAFLYIVSLLCFCFISYN